MQYGFVVPNNFGVEDPTQLIELAVEAEALGFDWVWVNHHVLNIGYVRERLEQAPYHDALMTLAWIGAATQQIRLGTSVLVMPYLNPLVLAKELSTLDNLTAGRLLVGLGVGSNPAENQALGVVPYEARGQYADEFITVLKGLWCEPEFTFQGHFFQLEGLISAPKPTQLPHPPILVGGNRPPALRRAGRLADGWHGLNLPPDSVRKRLPMIASEAEKTGRSTPAHRSVRLDIAQVDLPAVDAYEAVGVTELVVSLASGNIDANREAIEQFALQHSLTSRKVN